MTEIIATTQLVAAIQGVVLGCIIMMRRNNRPANNLLAAMIFLISLSMLSGYLAFHGLHPFVLALSFIVIPGMLLYGPLLFFYTQAMTTGVTIRYKKQWCHFMPAFLLLILHVVMACTMPVSAHPHPDARSIPGPLVILMVCASFIGPAYTIATLRQLILYIKHAGKKGQPIARETIIWLHIIPGFMLVMYLILNIGLLINILAMEDGGPPILIPIIMMMLINIVLFFGIRQPDIFSTAIKTVSETEGERLPEGNGNGGVKYGKHSIDDAAGEAYRVQVLEYMKKSKPYVNENLTLQGLAQETGIPAHHLSIVINQFLGQNYHSFINRYRIDEVISGLASPVNGNKNILSLAYEAGFNSKSTFNNMFKKVTGMTPSAYRKSRSTASN